MVAKSRCSTAPKHQALQSPPSDAAAIGVCPRCPDEPAKRHRLGDALEFMAAALLGDEHIGYLALHQSYRLGKGVGDGKDSRSRCPDELFVLPRVVCS
jgi:hypothetical protein